MRRRSVLGSCVAMAASAIALPALASSRRAIAPMTDGPFYPPRAWRERWTDWDADLTTVQRDGRTLTAGGERFGLDLQLADTGGRIVDGAEVEIWQCDAMAVYHHPRVPLLDGRHDEGFQGFGAARSSREGKLAFRTIRPVPYPGRTPHIRASAKCRRNFLLPTTRATPVTFSGAAWPRPTVRPWQCACKPRRPAAACSGWHSTRSRCPRECARTRGRFHALIVQRASRNALSTSASAGPQRCVAGGASAAETLTAGPGAADVVDGAGAAGAAGAGGA
jgi:Dioxygenase